MKFILRPIILLTLILNTIILSSCDNDEPEPTSQANRTILVYMVARNTLGAYQYDQNDLNEMLEAASSPEGLNGGRLLVFHAPISGAPQLKEITAQGINILKEYDQSISCVESKTMQQIITDAKAFAPANDYGLILWSHANGWLQTGIADSSYIEPACLRNNNLKPTAFGEDKRQNMNVTTLAQTLKNQQFSFIYFDCCYMACVEVAYEMRHTTPYIIASTTEILGDGMPYNANLKHLFADTPQLVEACQNTFDFYNTRLDESRTCTISLIKTSGMEALASATRNIYATKAFADKSYKPQRFMTEVRCYHFDLADHIHSLPVEKSLLEKWDNAIADVVIYSNNTPYLWNILKIDSHCGLSTYILDDNQDYSANKYKYFELQWWNDVVSHRF